MLDPQLRGERTGPEALDQACAAAGSIRWIGEDQIEKRARAGRAVGCVATVHPGDRIIPDHLRSVRKIERRDVAAQQPHCSTIRLDKMDVRRTPRQRFDSQSPGAGVEVGDPGAIDIAGKRGKPGLPHALGRGTGAPSTGGVDEAAAQVARDDAKPQLTGRVRRETPGRG